ncbi:MAG: DUF5659 domain-containing protein [Patescibacteria group bacterium]|nr:DUF5659 domain-containing protein [Patescibacteria group bacterium]
MEDLREYKSNDFYQAVVLKTAGVPLIRLEKSTGHFFIFVFDDPNNKAEEIISKFWTKELQVNAKEFVENISEIKSRIHSGF